MTLFSLASIRNQCVHNVPNVLCPGFVPVLEGRHSNFIVDEVNFNDCVDILDFFALAVSPMVQKLAESNTKEENGGGTNAKPTPDAKDAMGKPNNLVDSSAPDPLMSGR